MAPPAETVRPVGPDTKAKLSVLAGRSESVAVAVALSAVCSAMVWVPGTVRTGAVFTSVTITWKLLVALRLGVPLSKTRTVTVLVLGPCASVGVQAMAPPAETVRPVGPDTKAKPSVLAGRSESVAVALTLSAVCSAMVWVPGTVRTGAVFTSVTITWKPLVALRLGVPLSKTRTVTVLVLGPCASVGVQAMAPPAETVRPVGPVTKAKLSVLAGRSESVAVALMLSAVCSAMVCVPGTVRTGAVFTSVTITWKLLVALRLGVPLSKTRTVTVLVLGPCASVGVQAMAPAAETVRPVGPVTKAKLSVLAGRSESVAVALTLSAVCSAMVWVPGNVRTGAVFTSVTIT